MNLQEAEAKAALTQAAQAADDKAGNMALTATLPGPLLDVFSPAPDIKVGPFTVRRFVNRDFVMLSQLGHPLKRLSALADGSYNFDPSDEPAWQLCWLLTQPIEYAKDKMKDVAAAKEDVATIFGEMTVQATTQVIKAIIRQLEVYASARVDFEPNETGGDEGKSPPPLSPA